MAYRVALRLTGNHHDAQDVAQEALIAAWENLARFRAGSSFSTWLYQIVTRRALNKVSRARAASSLDLLPDVADPAGEPAAQTERNLAADAVTDALVALPFPQRVVIVLHHFEGLSYAETASVIGSTGPAVAAPVPCPAGTGKEAGGLEVSGPVVNDPPPGDPATRRLLGASTLACGADVDLLLERVADGRGADQDAHQQQCVHCQAALSQFTALWGPVAELAAAPVLPPPGLVASVMSQMRALVRDIWYTLEITESGAIRIAARIVAALARDCARMIPGSGSLLAAATRA